MKTTMRKDNEKQGKAKKSKLTKSKAVTFVLFTILSVIYFIAIKNNSEHSFALSITYNILVPIAIMAVRSSENDRGGC